jgi:sigma-E factor negative regulatory protein RseB
MRTVRRILAVRLRPSPRWLLAATVALVACPFLTGSSQAAGTDIVPGSDPSALALLRAAVLAESTLTYGGVEDVVGEDPGDDDASGSAAGTTSRSDVVAVSHVAGEGTVLMVRGSSIGTRAGFLGAGARRPDLFVDLLQRSYRVVLDGTATVAGRPTRVVAVQDANGVVAARFWVDDATGLLLRRDLVDGAGRTTASLAFRAVSLSDAPVAFLPPLLPTASTGGMDKAALASYRSHGWPVDDRLAGMSLFDARRVSDQGAGSEVLHLSYSDGLSTVSVFVQKGRLDVADVPGARRTTVAGQRVLSLPGQPRQLLWDAGGFVVTVVADADRDQVSTVVAALPHATAAPSGWGRVERGLSRMVSWVNPFD